MNKVLIFSVGLMLILFAGCQPKLSAEEARELDKRILRRVAGCVHAQKVDVQDSNLCIQLQESCNEAKENNHENKYCTALETGAIM
ncbi:hypothetical protein [Neisseria zoodegmatis]|uniref:Lipoprotein n=1 Tax=Neisseria zoodegmatis TaxID=326523 RepID=A0AB38DTC0_9NEIS|nr:hypothetical protein [Neisseria zoodegmatis]OSI10957.1 hypothetical protein BWD10_03340 [Neisseria zoodegmatis]SNU80198.1 Uncharacterised protein [Neisseria zoodegmatis]